MAYKVYRANVVTRDLDRIEGYLLRTYMDFGDDPEAAAQKATARIEDALGYLRGFVDQPHRGTEHPDMRPGVRTVTSRRFVYYFEVDESLSEVRILAIFFGGVDHQRQILERLSH